MKTILTKIIYAVIFSGILFFAGCSSLRPAPYSFAGDETNSASISFSQGNPRVSFVFYNNSGLPEPEKETYWEPVLFPSGVPLEITVHAYYQEDNSGVSSYFMFSSSRRRRGGVVVGIGVPFGNSRFVDTDVLFSCPPLEAGKEYKLTFRKESGFPDRNRLVLTENATGRIVRQQEFN